MCIMLNYTYVVYLNTSSGCSSSKAEFLKQSYRSLARTIGATERLKGNTTLLLTSYSANGWMAKSRRWKKKKVTLKIKCSLRFCRRSFSNAAKHLKTWTASSYSFLVFASSSRAPLRACLRGL